MNKDTSLCPVASRVAVTFTALALLSFFPSRLCGEVLVSNVRASQQPGTKIVLIDYDLAGGPGSFTVSLRISNTAGATFNVPGTSLSGAFGAGMTPGLAKRISWNAGADWNGNVSKTMVFEITAAPTSQEFALIPAGTFQMGDTFAEGYSNELPVHTVHVTTPFYMGTREVTKALWDEVRAWGANHGYTDLPAGEGKGPDHPVHSINQLDVIKWMNARSERDGLTPHYHDAYSDSDGTSTDVYRKGTKPWSWYTNANGYRLPTEAEWEKAARGGLSGKRFPWGDTISHSQANYFVYSVNGVRWFDYDLSPTLGLHPEYGSGGVPYTSPVGSFSPNGFGLYDVTGNVSEWCYDGYASSYYSSPGEETDPLGAVSPVGVQRGGSWVDAANVTRVACRNAMGLTYSTQNYAIGFRLVRGAFHYNGNDSPIPNK